MATLAVKDRSRFVSALGGTGRCVFLSGQLGLKAFIAAPIIVALSVLTEFAQHVAEVKLGMFDSKEAFRALANDPVRWAFGYAKIAGLVAATLLTARFWASGSAIRAILMPPRDLGRLAIAIALLIGSSEALDWLGNRSGSEWIAHALTGLNWIGQAVLMVMVVGALLGDRQGWRRELMARLPTSLLLVLLGAVLFIPLQLLHSANHTLAFGQPDAILWALMVFDSVVVGMMATMVGASLFVAYRAGPTWRGWSRDPATIS